MDHRDVVYNLNVVLLMYYFINKTLLNHKLFSMRKFIYLFFITMSLSIVRAQNSQTEISIEKKITEVASDTVKKPQEIENELLQLKRSSEKNKYTNGILRSGVNLMRLYLLQSKNKEAANLGIELKKIAGNTDPKGLITDLYMKNALALGYLGLDDEAQKDFRKALYYSKTIKDEDKKNLLVSICYENMTVYFHNAKRYENKKYRDSIFYYLKKSDDAIRLVSDKSSTVNGPDKYQHVGFIDMKLGVFYLEQATKKGNVDLAEKYLLEGYKIYFDKKYKVPIDNRVMILNQLSWLYMEKEEYQKSIDFANRAIAMEKQYSDPYHRVESFEFLATSYLEIGEKEKSKYYMQKYTALKDSINVSEKGDTNKTMQKIVSEVNQEHKESSKKIFFIIGVLILIAGTVTAFLLKRKDRNLRQKYEKIIESLSNEDSQYIEDSVDNMDENTDLQEDKNDLDIETSTSYQKNTISSETETRILKKLAAFEKSTKFLKKDLTIGLLAGQLNTNSKYLSEIIKYHRSQNFSNYINQLKINFIIHKLYNEPSYREYKISYLADVCGYSSPQVFVIAFKKIHGMTPSYFIESLKEDDMSNTNPDS